MIEEATETGKWRESGYTSIKTRQLNDEFSGEWLVTVRNLGFL